MTTNRTGTANDVPYLAIPPSGSDSASAPIVIAWHLMAPPFTKEAMAAAMPMASLNAWRIYVDLPMCGERMLPGGMDEMMQLAYADSVRNVQGTIAPQVIKEFPGMLRDLRDQLGVSDGPVGLVGGSMGSCVAGNVALHTDQDIAALVLISPMSDFAKAIDATGRVFGVEYPWDDETREIARRYDLVGKADRFVQRGAPAVRLIVGSEDDAEGFVDPARQLADELRAAYDDSSRVSHEVVDGMGHPFADDPGIEPAPQTEDGKRVDHLASDWFAEHVAG